MKCQSCNYVCSETNDLCPRCLVDLRPVKKALGFVIEHPNAPYSELLEAKKRSLSEDPKPASIITTEKNTSAYDFIANAFKREAPLSMNDSLQNVVSSNMGGNQLNQAESQNARNFNSQFLIEKDLIGQLFNSANDELANQENSEFELATFQPENHQEIRLFFDLAEQSITDPSTESKYTQIVSTADTKVLESSFLAKQLSTVEKAMTTGLINLRSTFKLDPAKNERTTNNSVNFSLLDKSSVAIMHLVDFSATFTIALLCWFGYLKQGEGYFWVILSDSSSTVFLADLLALFSSFSVMLIWATYSYYFIMLNVFGSTFGMDLTNSKVIHFSGREATAQERFNRSLMLPTSLMVLTWVLDFKNQFNWADKLTNTVCGQETP